MLATMALVNLALAPYPGGMQRKGVPQGRQPHVLLHRGLLVAEELLPDIHEDLSSHGAVPFDTGTWAWLGEYGWSPPGFHHTRGRSGD